MLQQYYLEMIIIVRIISHLLCVPPQKPDLSTFPLVQAGWRNRCAKRFQPKRFLHPVRPVTFQTWYFQKHGTHSICFGMRVPTEQLEGGLLSMGDLRISRPPFMASKSSLENFTTSWTALASACHIYICKNVEHVEQ